MGKNGLKLYAVYLGGKYPGGYFGERHELVFVVGRNMAQAKTEALEKWSGEIRYGVHVDAVKLLREVDGYRIVLENVGPQVPSEADKSLFSC